MPTEALYHADAYAASTDAVVVAIDVTGDRPFAVLDRTILYPEGGGQPADRGWLGDVAVVDVRRVGDDIRHYLDPAGAAAVAGSGSADPMARAGDPDAALAGQRAGAVHVRLDWERRFDHMQQHTAQHLVTALAADRFGWPTTAFHLGADVSDVELDVPGLDSGDLDALEEAVTAEIRASRPVTARWVDPGALDGLAVRTRGLPAGHAGAVRLVEIAGIDLNTCGGTHVRSTAEIESVKLLGSEPMRGGTRLHFVAGRRVRRLLGRHVARTAALRHLLGVPDDALPAAVADRLARAAAREREVQDLVAALADMTAQSLKRDPDPFPTLHLPGRDMPFLQAVARAYRARDARRSALVTAADPHAGDGGPHAGAFVWVIGDDAVGAGVDEAAVGAELAAVLGGKGGGAGAYRQGKATRLDRRAEAVAMLRAACVAESPPQ